MEENYFSFLKFDDQKLQEETIQFSNIVEKIEEEMKIEEKKNEQSTTTTNNNNSDPFIQTIKCYNTCEKK